MRIALISDIHGNTVALDAVLVDLGSADVIGCLGDIAAGGPDPGGAIDRIAELECVVVQGNTDAGIVDVPDWWREPSLIGLPDAAVPGMEICVWGAEVVSASQRAFLAELPTTANVDVDRVSRLLAFHGSPRSIDDFIAATTPDAELHAMFARASHELLAGGHTHVPLVRRYGRQTIVNPGSVGMPFAEYGFAGGVGVLAHAAYALMTDRNGEVTIELRTVAVDNDRVLADVRRSDMPNAEWWLGLRRAR